MKRSLVQIVADNARAAYEASEFKSYRALGKRAGVADNTVKNIIEPEARAPSARGDTSPRMDVVEKIAEAMGYRAWQLMQPNFTPADPPTKVLRRREAAFYDKIREAYDGLDKSEFDGNSA